MESVLIMRMPNRRPAGPAWERWLPLAFVALALLALVPLFRHPFRFAEKSDWRYFQTITEIGRRSVVWWHQWPLWNPFMCGGEVLLANPQSEVAAPTFLLSLLLGTALGMKLSLALYLFCACDGMYRLCRQLELTPVGALLASVSFGVGGWIVLHLLVGHTNFASVSLFPYLILFYRRSLTNHYEAIPLGAIAAWIVALGGTATPAMATILMLTVAVIDVVARRSLVPLQMLLLASLCTIVLSAYRLFPALEFALAHPRRQWQSDATSIAQLIADGYRWKSDDSLPGKLYRFHEYGWRMSYVTAPLLLWSVTLRRYRSWWLVAAVGAAIAAGAAIPYGPWWLLKHVPIFRDLRVPSRYTVMLALAAPILCGAALADLTARLRPRARAWAGGAVVALATVDVLLFAWARFGEIAQNTKELASPQTPFYQVEGHWRTMMEEVLQGHGVVSCLEEAPLQRAEQLELGPSPQQWLADASAGTIGDVSWSPNRISVAVELKQPAVLIINENWNEHWKANKGRLVKFGNKYSRDENGGTLAVELPAGAYTVQLYYRPISFVVGAAVSVVAAPLLMALWWRRRRRAYSA
jgi:hypothetical protein